MDSAVPSEDTDILTVVEDEVIESLYDVPFVTVNRVGDEIHAEVFLTGVVEIDEDRIMTAHAVARDNGGFRSYSRVYGDWGQVLIRFSNDPSKGIIWALQEEMGSDWLN